MFHIISVNVGLCITKPHFVRLYGLEYSHTKYMHIIYNFNQSVSDN